MMDFNQYRQHMLDWLNSRQGELNQWRNDDFVRQMRAMAMQRRQGRFPGYQQNMAQFYSNLLGGDDWT